jgi:hypothetical protein
MLGGAVLATISSCDDGTSTPSNGASSGVFANDAGSADEGRACIAQEVRAEMIKRPIDVLFVIDNSASMVEEIVEVESEINVNFANIIEGAGVDYRVIVLSGHGLNTNQRICIAAPLSGAATCAPPPTAPVESARFFHHSTWVDSNQPWCQLLTSFGAADELGVHPEGYGVLLREDAFKVIVVITDDRPFCVYGANTLSDSFDPENAAAEFEAALFGRSPQFGTAAKRNYVFHTIAGMNWANVNDRSLAHAPDAPLVGDRCGDEVMSEALGYQALSRLTGGLRYPSCSPSFTTIFNEIAKGVIEGAQLPCHYELPPPPAGATLDLATVVPTFASEPSAAPVDFRQVASEEACLVNDFYIAGGEITLCPDTCAFVKDATAGYMKIKYGCAVEAAR